jgi:Flp pilus assembly protein TadD
MTDVSHRSVWRRRAAAWTLAVAVGAGMAGPAVADPSTDDKDAAARDPDYAAGKQALERKDWSQAVQRLGRAALRDPENADLQNSLGYAHRNLGQLEPAFRHYARALELNPRHRGAHEYIGEAYLLAGDVARAEQHLEALRRICLVPCDELADLEREVTAYRAKRGAR